MKKILIAMLMALSVLFISCSKSTDNTKTPSTDEVTATIAPTVSANDPDASNTPTGEEFKIGILPAESAIPIILAVEKGFFEEEGVNVSIQSFSSPGDRNVAVQAKELDATIADVMTVATFRENGINMKITSDISEDFKILSSPASGITDMKGLSDKKISLVPNFILEYIMDQFAKEEGFTYEIVEIPSFSGRAEALMSNQIDGVVFTEPQAGMLVSQGAHLLGSSKESNIKGGALLFSDQMITEQPGDIRAFYRGYNKAVDYMNSTEVTEYGDILANYQFPEAIGTYLTSLTEDFQYAGVIETTQFDSIIAWTKEKGLITTLYSFDDITDFSFLP
jgi:NitT/TauT family transport system substrate-binding protein